MLDAGVRIADNRREAAERAAESRE